MAKLTIGGNLEVATTISKEEVLSALRELTLYNTHFNADLWCSADAEDLYRIAALIKAEIQLKVEARNRGF